jgi:hypothetical protein
LYKNGLALCICAGLDGGFQTSLAGFQAFEIHTISHPIYDFFNQPYISLVEGAAGGFIEGIQ